MLFYYKDRYEYNTHIHSETKNVSFLKMSNLLHTKGIKNNKFMLSLLDRELIHIDPHNLSDPSIELAMRISVECKRNPWYFLREVVRVPAQGDRPKSYILHRGNMALTWCFYQNIDTFLMLPRQHYKTVSTMAIIAHLIFLATQNYPITLFTKDSKLVSDNVSRLRDIKHALPPFLISKSVNDKENVEEIYYKALNNRYIAICAQNDPLSADKVGRGASTPMQQYDEIDFIKYISTMYGVALAATNEARENAKGAGSPHANILTSTAGFLDTEEGAFAQSLRSDSLLFYDKLYDCDSQGELNDIIKTNSANKMMLIIYSFLQLGKTHEWIQEVRARGKSSDADFQRDYYLIPVSGQGDDGIPPHLLKNLRNHQLDPIHTIRTVDKLITHWYITEEFKNSNIFKNRQYVLGLDSSEGIGNDWISTVLLDTTDLSVTSTFRINEINVIKVGKHIANFLIENDNVVFIPESRSTGRQILDIVLLEFQKHGINPYKRIYNEVVQNLNDEKFKNYDIHDYHNIADSGKRKVFGFSTSGSGVTGRNRLFADTLFRALETNGTRIYDANLINEFCGLRIRGGRLDHASGNHDDMVVAYLLACYLIYFGTNLHIYGLDVKTIASRIDAKGNVVEPEAKNEKERIINRIQELENLIKSTKSNLLMSSYKRELNHLKSMENYIPDLNIEETPITINELKSKSSTDVNRTKEFYTSLLQSRQRNFMNPSPRNSIFKL